MIESAMATSVVKLFGSRHSPFVNRVVMALEMKSIDFELVDMNPYQKSELLIKINPVHKKIPVLVHGDRPICESLIIVQYIDDAWTHGPSILPHDTYDSAMARFWAAFVDDKLVPLIGQIMAPGDDKVKGEVLEKMFEALVLLEEALIKCSKGKAFFGGDNVGYLDIALGSFVGYIKVAELMIGTEILDETKTPRLVVWAERLYSDSVVKDAMPNPQKLLELLKKFEAMLKASSD